MKKLILLLLFVFSAAVAQNNQELFSTANALYKEGKYQKAVEIYESIVASDQVSSELFHNLGNAYYKLNKVAPAIYNYEKALKLNPNDEDAQNNLIFANRLTIDRIEALPKSFSQKLNDSLFSKLHFNAWGVLAILFAFIAVLLFILFYFSFSPSKKRLFFSLSLVSVFLVVSSYAIAFQQYKNEEKTIEAIVFSEQVNVQTEPISNATEAFIIHEGTKVKVLDTVDDWKKIKLADGKIGWLKNSDIKVI